MIAPMTAHYWSGSADGPGASPAVPIVNTLVIREWQEPHRPHGFRARIRFDQAHGSGVDTLTASDPSIVLQAVCEWLSALPGAAYRD